MQPDPQNAPHPEGDRVEAALRQAVRPAASAQRVWQRIEESRRRAEERSARRRLAWRAAVAAAAVLTAAVVLWIRLRPGPQPPPPPQAYPAPSAVGSFTIVGGGEVRRGAEVASDASEPATLTLGGYCRVELAPGTRLTIGGAERAEAVLLEEGQVTCEADPGVGSFEVHSEVGTVSVKGTRFSVALEDETDPLNPFAGGISMATRRLVVAVFAGAVLVSGPWGNQLLAAGQGQVFQAAAPAPPANPAPPNPPPAEHAKSLAEVLATKVNVSYQRAYVSEVMTNDLSVRVGLRHAFAEPVARCATFTFERKDVAVKDLIERLAKDCGLEIEYRGETAIFWKKADDQALAALAKKLRDGDVQARCEAAHDLALLADPRVYAPLFEALNDKDPAVVMWTVKGLVSHAEPNVSRLWGFGGGTREGTLRYAGGLGPVAETLKKYLTAPPAGTSEADLITLLAEVAQSGATDKASVADLLIAQLKNDDLAVVMRAAQALGDLGDSRALAALQPLVDREAPRNPQGGTTGLYLTLKDACDQIQDPKAHAAKRTQPVPLRPVEDLADDLASGDLNRLKRARGVFFMTNSPAAYALAHDPRLIDALLEALLFPDPMLKTRAMFCLEKTGDPRAVEPVMVLLHDEDAQVRGVAARTLGALRDPRAFDSLLALLDREKPPAKGAQAWQNPRAAILGALAATRDPRALDLLFKHLGDTELGMRAAAESGLRDFRDPRARQALLAVLKSTGGVIPVEVHVPIMETVPAAPGVPANRGPKQVMKGTRTEMRDQEDTTLLASLREIQDTALVEQMAAALREPDLGTTAKKGLILALGRSDDPRCVPALLATAKDPDAGLRAAAARGLPPDPRCLDAFAALLADADTSVVQAAVMRLSGSTSYSAYTSFPLTRRLGEKTFRALLAAFQASLAHDEDDPVPASAAWGALIKTRDPRAARALLDAYDKAPDPMKRQLEWLLWSARGFASPEDAAKIDKLVGSKFLPPAQF